MYFLRWVVVGLIAGFAMSRVLPNKACGTPVNVILGVMGAVIGGDAMRSYGFGIAPTVVVAILGSVVLIAIVHAISRGPSSTGKMRKAA